MGRCHGGREYEVNIKREEEKLGRCESLLISSGEPLTEKQAEAAENNALAWMGFLRLQWHVAAWGQHYRPTLPSSL